MNNAFLGKHSLDTDAADEELLDGESLLLDDYRGEPPAPDRANAKGAGEPPADSSGTTQVDPHYELFSKQMYPSAKECRTCHEQIYREWSVSGHAYAAVSPMFHKFEQTMYDLTRGTIGYFCLRCHSPVGTSMAMPRAASIMDAIPAAREGITCIVCHRVVERYDKVNAERRIETGSIFAPVTGSSHGEGLEEVLAKMDHYKVKTSDDDKLPGQPIHGKVIHFQQISTSHFCISCHQVSVYPGIKLEVVWDQYRASPAYHQGVRCQDCHMGAVPGQPAGFDSAPGAIVNEQPINPHRRHSNHMFVGPGYSIAHPGTFPHHPKADQWTPKEWLEFDWRAGWGTQEFEQMVRDGRGVAEFPQPWREADDRMDAREIINENQQLMAEKSALRYELMQQSSKVDGPYFASPPRVGKPLQFHFLLRNLNTGHNLPTGSLGAQPQLWFNVVLTGPTGQPLWESGYVDANGDMADLHSLEVAAGRVPRDSQLVNLQTKFLITTVNGTDREMYLPVNIDIDQLPFIRPSGFPITTMNHPPFIRMEAHSIPATGHRKARYRVPAKLLHMPGRYRLTVRLRSRAEPIYFMRFCGATPEMERAMNEHMLDFHQHAYEFVVR